jgi:CopG family nickel-responsive transcriptional regulator
MSTGRDYMLKRFGISIEEDLLENFDTLCEKKGYANRSEAIRDMIRDRLVDEEWDSSHQDMVAVVSIVYDHAHLELPKTLTSDQHAHHDLVVVNTHVHIDHDNCLETIVLRGEGHHIKPLAEQMISRRGVKHGKVFYTTTGKTI